MKYYVNNKAQSNGDHEVHTKKQKKPTTNLMVAKLAQILVIQVKK